MDLTSEVSPSSSRQVQVTPMDYCSSFFVIPTRRSWFHSRAIRSWIIWSVWSRLCLYRTDSNLTQNGGWIWAASSVVLRPGLVLLCWSTRIIRLGRSCPATICNESALCVIDTDWHWLLTKFLDFIPWSPAYEARACSTKSGVHSPSSSGAYRKPSAFPGSSWRGW